jgi:hypothetical protein
MRSRRYPRSFAYIHTRVQSDTSHKSKHGTSKTGTLVTKAARGQTLKICEGVPIPEGYIIIAYENSSACTDGAYVLKKDDGSPGRVAASVAISKFVSQRGGADNACTRQPSARFVLIECQLLLWSSNYRSRPRWARHQNGATAQALCAHQPTESGQKQRAHGLADQSPFVSLTSRKVHRANHCLAL